MAALDMPGAVPAQPRKISSRIWRLAASSIEFRIGLVVFLALVLAAALYPELSGIDPLKMNIRAKLAPPSSWARAGAGRIHWGPTSWGGTCCRGRWWGCGIRC